MNAKGKKIGEILKAAGIKTPKGFTDTLVTRIAIDSRRVVPGSLFFALPGLRTDGGAYIGEAIARGAVGIVSKKSKLLGKPKVAIVQTDDPRKALAKVSRAFFDYPDRELTLAGITGTNGKTTVSGLVQHLLMRDEVKVGCLGTVSYDLVGRTLPSFRTTPEAHDLCDLLGQMKSFGCSKAVMEVSSHALKQLRVAGLEYDVATFLNLTHDHLDYHGDMDEYYAVKSMLFEGKILPRPKRMVINADDEFGRKLISDYSSEKPVSFGMSEAASIRAKDVQLFPDRTEVTLVWPEAEQRVLVPLIGRYNVSNTLAAIASCYALGEDMGECIQRLETFPGVPGRMELVEAGQAYKVVVDYAHTGDAMSNALGMLREITAGRLIVVFGCGGNRDRGKREQMTRISQENADFTWATSDNPRSESIESIFEDMKNGVIDKDSIEFVSDRRRAIELALKSAGEGDCVLIAGKGHESFQEFGDTVVPFDDRRVARELIELKRLGEEGVSR